MTPPAPIFPQYGHTKLRSFRPLSTVESFFLKIRQKKAELHEKKEKAFFKKERDEDAKNGQLDAILQELIRLRKS